MSWISDLYETYEYNQGLVGKIQLSHNNREYTLLPVSHTTQNAHIEVQITEDGSFHSASVVDKTHASTLIPCTEASASRAGAVVAPYPLHDKLAYVAGDFTDYGGEIKRENPFEYYIRQLQNWAESPFSTPKVKSIFKYLKKGTLIQELVEHKILYVNGEGRLIEKWDKDAEEQYGEKPEIFSVVGGGQTSAFVRFNVHSPTATLTEVWKDEEVYESFVQFYSSQLGNEDVCYVLGQSLPRTDKHANKIRNAADKAKLISANDTSGFTFRGRFNRSEEAVSISYEASQKAHNALKWLINRQGKIIDQRVFLVWTNEGTDVPDPLEDYYSLDPSPVPEKKISFTNQELAREVAKALDGFRNRLKPGTRVNFLILDSATTGRMAVIHYRHMDKDLYLDRLVKWHSTCIWLHRYRKNEDGDFVRFLGAPSTRDIAFAAYGPRASDKVVKGLVERMLPCLIDDRAIPRDIVSSACHRASNPVAMERWEWEKTLSVTCALINRQEGKDVSLDTETNDRDYLFGRLLAVADVLERRALGSEETRVSNAIRYMNSYSRHPERTWKTIQDSLQPYQARLGTKGTYLSRIIDEIASRISITDFNNKPLSGRYLLGFYSQRHELYQKRETPNVQD